MKTSHILLILTTLTILASCGIIRIKTIVRPTSVEYDHEHKQTLIHFSKGDDFILPGYWDKYQETVDQTMFFLEQPGQFALGIRKKLKKDIGYRRRMPDSTMLKTHLAYLQKGWQEKGYQFNPIKAEPTGGFVTYRIWEQDSTLKVINSDTLRIPPYDVVCLLGLKDEWAFDFTAFPKGLDRDTVSQRMGRFFLMN